MIASVTTAGGGGGGHRSSSSLTGLLKLAVVAGSVSPLDLRRQELKQVLQITLFSLRPSGKLSPTSSGSFDRTRGVRNTP